MLFTLVFVGLVVLLIYGAIQRHKRREERLQRIESLIDELQASLRDLQSQLTQGALAGRGAPPLAPGPELAEAEAASVAMGGQVPVAEMLAEAPIAEPESAVEPEESLQPAVAVAAEAAQPPPSWEQGALAPATREAATAERWQRLEQAFVENWTGILGAVVLVAGVTFLGIYTALRMEPLARFLMTLAGAGALGGLSLAARRRTDWQALAQWLQSSAAAVLLFACAAAGGLPGLGLQWLYAPLPALSLLLGGVAVNLTLAWLSRTQTFASLHVVLSLLPFAIVPPTLVGLATATLVVVLGMTLARRARWDVHVLVVTVAWFAWHVQWYLRSVADLDDPALRAAAALAVVAVFAATALVHYRRDYVSLRVEPVPLAVHLGNWGFLALACLVYAPERLSGAAGLAVGGVVAWALGRRARVLGIRWLHLCDTLIAQGLMVAAIACATELFAAARLLWLLAVVAECALFLRLVIDENEAVLGRIGVYVLHVSAFLLAAAGLATAPAAIESGDTREALVLLAGMAVVAALQVYLARRRPGRLAALGCYAAAGDGSGAPVASLGWIAGLLALVGLVHVAGQDWLAGVALALAAVLLLLARRSGATGFAGSFALVVLGGHALSWWRLIVGAPWTPGVLTEQWVPLVALAGLAVATRLLPWLRTTAVLLAAANFGLGAFLYFNDISPLLPGVLWLMLSVLALEVANRVRTESPVLLAAGYGYLGAFGGNYALVVLQTQEYVLGVPVRLLVEGFALATLLYWWFFRPVERVERLVAWRASHPLLLETMLIFLSVVIVEEVPTQWRPAAWGLVGLLLGATVVGRRLDARCRTYALFFYWVSVVSVAVVSSVFETPSPTWYDRPDVAAVAAIALQVAYILGTRGDAALAGTAFPAVFGGMAHVAGLVDRRRRLWVYYPFFAGLAVFCFWRFDRSVLTLLWSIEAFVIFALGAALREKQFRYVSLAALAACLLRLVFVDLAQADLAVRGVVFLGVGLLMLGMNAIYNRYRTRFE